MNQAQTKAVNDYLAKNTTFATSKLHNNANTAALKRANYAAIKAIFDGAKMPNMGKLIIEEAAKYIGNKQTPKLTINVEQPPDPVMVANKLKLMLDDAAITIEHQGVTVMIDCDQKKHQHPDSPIGTRQTSAGNQFYDWVDADWHQENTMVHAGNWARLLDMAEGDMVEMKQGVARTDDLWTGGIHFEGKCLFTNNKKYVAFHCYPADNNKALRWR